jgi:multidrug efflux pump subunit AcrA (membrane-fusion protein)
MKNVPANLFRPEAVRFHQQQFDYPQIHAPHKRMLWPWMAGATIAVLIVLGLLQLTYSQSHRVSGKIDSRNVHIIRSNSVGHISDIFVSEGEVIKAGQPIISVKSQHDSREHASRIVEIANQITLKQQRLELLAQALRLAKNKYDLRAKAWVTKASLQDRRISLQKQKRQQLYLMSRDTQALLNKKFVSRQEWLGLTQTVVEADLSLLQLYQLREDIVSHHAVSEIMLAESQTQLRDSINQELQNISLLRERRSSLESGLQIILKAPASGTVGHHHISLHSQVNPGVALVNIHKTSPSHSATLFVPVKFRDYIAQGDPVHLKLERDGKNSPILLKTFISHIDDAAIPLQSSTKQQSSTYINLVRVEFNKGLIRSADNAASLNPGMPLEALIQLQDKTLLEHLYGFLNHALLGQS